MIRMLEGTDLGGGGGVPVELDGAVRLEVGFQQSPVEFRRNGDSAVTVVVRETLTGSKKEGPGKLGKE